MNHVHGEIRDYILQYVLQGEDGIELDSMDLIDTGVLDSMALLQMIEHLEKTYGITIDGPELVPESFQTIDTIATLVSQKTCIREVHHA